MTEPGKCLVAPSSPRTFEDLGHLLISQEDDRAVVLVRDDGAGIPPEMLESVFDLFVRALPMCQRTHGISFA